MQLSQRRELFKKWTVEHGVHYKDIAEQMGIAAGSFNNYLNRYTGTPNQKKFWKKVGEIMKIDFDGKEEVPPVIEKKDKFNLPPYVVTTLETKGRTIIESKIVSRYGKKRILNYLAKQGLKCIFVVAGTEEDPTDVLEIATDNDMRKERFNHG